MSSDETDHDDRELNVTTAKNYIGSARVHFSSLSFVKGREVDGQIVHYLLGLFQKTKCRRYDQKNYIRATIAPRQLRDVLRLSKISSKELKTPSQDGSLPFLYTTPPYKFTCYDGQHRIKAAEQHFDDPDDHWWTINLFLKRPNEDDFTNEWRDEFYHQSKFSDGEVFRNVLISLKGEDSIEAERWMQRLTHSKQICLQQLLKREDFTAAFGALSPFPGTWAGTKIGNTQRYLSSRFDEEWLRYLKHIRSVLDSITLGEKKFQAAFDIQTSKALQRRAPASCISDRDYIIDAMRTKLLFPGITDKDDRKLLKRAILRIKCLIPSIESMYENLKYLDVGAKLIKTLILGNNNRRRTLHDSLYLSWTKKTNISLETLSGKLLPISLDKQACWKLVYKQVWIVVLREFAELGGRRPRQEAGGSPYDWKEIPSLQFKLAKLVHDLGIKTLKVEQRLANDPRRETIRSSVAQLYPSRSKGYQERLVEKLLGELPQSREPEEAIGSKVYSTGCSRKDLERRWGVPFQNEYHSGKRSFYLPELLSDNPQRPERALSVSFLQRDFIFAFFGILEKFSAVPVNDDGDDEGSETADHIGNDNDSQMDVDINHGDSESSSMQGVEQTIVIDPQKSPPNFTSNQSMASFAQNRSTESAHYSSPSQVIPVIARDEITASPPGASVRETKPAPYQASQPPASYSNGEPTSSEKESKDLGFKFQHQGVDSVQSQKAVRTRASSLSIPEERPRTPLEIRTSLPRNNADHSVTSQFFATTGNTRVKPFDLWPSIPSHHQVQPQLSLTSYSEAQALATEDSERSEQAGSFIPSFFLSEDIDIPVTPRIRQLEITVSSTERESMNFALTPQFFSPGSSEFELTPDRRRSVLENTPGVSSNIAMIADLGRWNSLNLESQQFTFSLPPSLPRSGVNSIRNAEWTSIAGSGSSAEHVSEISPLPATDYMPEEYSGANPWEGNSDSRPPVSLLPAVSSTEAERSQEPQLTTSPRTRTNEATLSEQMAALRPPVETSMQDYDQFLVPQSIVSPGKVSTTSTKVVMAGEEPKSRNAQLGVDRRLADAPVLQEIRILRFIEYNGMRIKRLLYNSVSMVKYLKHRWDYIMFALEPKRKAFKVIHRSKVVQSMLQCPEKTYCLVKREYSEWWRRKGAIHMVNGALADPKFEHPGRSTLASSSLLRAKKKAAQSVPVLANTLAATKESLGHSVAGYHSEFEYILNEKLSTITVQEFGQEFSIQDCEQEFSDFRSSKEELACFLLQQRSIRTLQIFGADIKLSEAECKAADLQYTCFVAINRSLRKISVKDLTKCAEIGPVWLILREEAQQFAEERKESRRPVQISTPFVIPLPPETHAGPYSQGEEELFDSDDTTDVVSMIHNRDPDTIVNEVPEEWMGPKRVLEGRDTTFEEGSSNIVKSQRNRIESLRISKFLEYYALPSTEEANAFTGTPRDISTVGNMEGTHSEGRVQGEINRQNTAKSHTAIKGYEIPVADEDCQAAEHLHATMEDENPESGEETALAHERMHENGNIEVRLGREERGIEKEEILQAEIAQEDASRKINSDEIAVTPQVHRLRKRWEDISTSNAANEDNKRADATEEAEVHHKQIYRGSARLQEDEVKGTGVETHSTTGQPPQASLKRPWEYISEINQNKMPIKRQKFDADK